MLFKPTAIPGAFEIEIEPHHDERGFFARTWCQTEFERHGLNPRLSQCSVSFNKEKGTLRGLHYQDVPFPEAKLVRCTKGAIYDVIVDLRPDSATFKHHHGATLSAENHSMLYVPEGCAHGFLTLSGNTEVFYQISEFYVPELSRGVRWNDAAFGIAWPAEVLVISGRDNTYPDFK
jgi:dTDP-4-dehydrorhamnose 3,5-epimerase